MERKTKAAAKSVREPNRECKFFKTEKECTALKRMDCKLKHCKFYKPKYGGE